MCMGQTQRGNLGFAAEAGSQLGSLHIAAAAAVEHTGSGNHLDIADKAAGTLAVVQNDQTTEKVCLSTVGQVVPNHKT